MSLDLRMISLRILKCLFLLACVSILFSVYWLRPLTNEGSRYTLTLVQSMTPFFDNVNLRFLLIPFQVPALIAINLIPEISPLTIARLYFFSLYVPLITCLSVVFFRLKDQRSITLAALFFFIVFLPGMNFQLNHVPETIVVFSFSVFFALRQRLLPYLSFSLAAVLGHPGILGPILLMTAFFLTETIHFKKPEYRRFLFISIILIVLLTLKIMFTLRYFPYLNGNYLQAIIEHASEIQKSKQDFITACYLILITFFTAIIPLTRKYSRAVSLITLCLFVFFIFRENSREISHQAYQFRVFSIVFYCVLMIYGWFVLKWNFKPVGKLPYLCLILLSSWFTVREIKASVWFWKEAPSLARLELPRGCHYTDENSSYLYKSLPIYRIFLTNKRNVESVLYAVEFDPEKRFCSELTDYSLPYEFSPKGEIYSYQFHKNGFFTLTN